jgi:nucleotide-binding universal stress UspA family protein
MRLDIKGQRKKSKVFRKILAPTDLSEPSFQALKQAMALAKNSGAELAILRVLPSVGIGATALDEAQNDLNDLVRDYAPSDLAVSTLVRQGDVTGEILNAAKDGNYDLIVMATHGTTGWREFVLGSITGEVVRTAPCPVLTIGNDARR